MQYKTAKEVIDAHAAEFDNELLEGWSFPPYRQYLENICEIVWQGDYDERRWATFCTTVGKLQVGGVDYYLSYSDFTGGGDNDAEGVGYYFEGIENVQLVEPYEVTKIEYRAIKNENE